MKFKLLENMQEDLLTEKMWVRLHDNVDPNFQFYFYCNNNINDINTLLPIIKGTQTGSYKQQLNQDIVDVLKRHYRSCTNKNNYTLQVSSSNVGKGELLNSKQSIITITDRQLRKEADKQLLQKHFPNETKDWLIHHKVKGEYDNNPSNVALISRKSGDEFAHAVHKIIEKQGTNINSGTWTIPILEYTNNGWQQTHSVEITII